MLLLLLVAGGALLLLRPTPKAEGDANQSNAASQTELNDRTTQHLRLPQGGGVDTPLEDLVILESPTDSSAPQDESDPPSPSASEGHSGNTSEVAPSDSCEVKEERPVSCDFTLRILNGGGRTGAAAALQTELDGKGYEVLSIGNAQSTYSRTTVYYQAGKKTNAERVASSLGEPTPAIEENAIAVPADVLVVIGADR